MDPIASINAKKDSTLAMLLESQRRGWINYEIQLGDLRAKNGRPFALMRKIQVANSLTEWFTYLEEIEQDLAELDLILMRKDPPFNMEYIYTTYLLERAEAEGTLVFNKPQSLRDANEKLFTMWFEQCCPPTLITRQISDIKKFIAEHKEIVLKPPDGMGGHSIFLLKQNDPNINVVADTITARETRFVIAQRYVPEGRAGDKRVLLIDGVPYPYAVARIPPDDDFRGNLAVGAKGVGIELSERDRWICSQLGDTLRDKGLVFVGIDILGDYLTEINVTSPTGIREIDQAFGGSVCKTLFDCFEQHLAQRTLHKIA
jgi:glutathione synthase